MLAYGTPPGDHGYPSIILEAVASQDMWIWHVFFGSVGSLNDISVLNKSPIFNKMYDGIAPDSSFDLRGRHYRFRYYLIDGIYPKHSVFIKTLSCPDDTRRVRFKRAQEKERKDVERAFGALKKRWHILRKSSIFSDKIKMTEVMYTCIILHNMILEDEGNAICDYDEHEVIPETHQLKICGIEYMQRCTVIHNSEIHHDLRHALTDHLWTLNNIDLNVPLIDGLDGQFSEDDFL